MPKLPPRPKNETPLQKAYHDYIRGKATYSKYKQAIENSVKEKKEAQNDNRKT